jgi:glycosyltransferase involved in cell wall biosynthesis
MNKIQVYHFHNGSGGGVLSVIRNLLQFSNNLSIDNHVIYTINKDVVKHFPIINLNGAVSEQVFYYSPNSNFYYTCRQLAKLLPDENAIIIAHDWLELGMASSLGLQNKVIQIIHGDYEYYYNLARLHTLVIDSYITVAKSIKDKLQLLLPERKEEVKYLRFPVPASNCVENDKKDRSIIYIGRCTEEKGYHLLPAIAKELQSQEIYLQWHIVGELNDREKEKYPWDASIDVVFHELLPNEKVNELLCKMQFFILPSFAEGMPVSLIESMKAGVIPLVNDIDGGIQELVIDNETGYKIQDNSVEIYVNRIAFLIANKNIAELMKKNCIAHSVALFDPVINTNLIEKEVVTMFFRKNKNKSSTRVYGSRLDQQWVPNFFTKSLRELR